MHSAADLARLCSWRSSETIRAAGIDCRISLKEPAGTGDIMTQHPRKKRAKTGRVHAADAPAPASSVAMSARGRFLEALGGQGMKNLPSQADYIRQMESRFGRLGSEFLDAADEAMAPPAPHSKCLGLYDMLAVAPQMAKLVAIHQFASLYRDVGLMLVDSGVLKGRVVVDFGCGFGLLTRCLAEALPMSRFVGVDRASIAMCARNIVGTDGPSNLEFVSADSAESLHLENCIVLMVMVTHELFEARLDAPVSGPGESGQVRELAEMARWAGPSGLLVTVNRFPYPKLQLPILDAAMADVGMRPRQSPLPSVVSSMHHLAVEEERFAVAVYGT